MIKTINRIRLPEVNSGVRTFPRISSNLFVDRKGVLRSSVEIHQPVIRMHWRCDAATGMLVAYWESGEEPGSCLHISRYHPFHYSVVKRTSLSI
jgi:hypothetical protein